MGLYADLFPGVCGNLNDKPLISLVLFTDDNKNWTHTYFSIKSDYTPNNCSPTTLPFWSWKINLSLARNYISIFMIFSYYLKSTFFLFANGCFIKKKKINFEDQYMVHIAVLKKNRFNDYWEIRDQIVELRK